MNLAHSFIVKKSYHEKDYYFINIYIIDIFRFIM